MKPSKKYFISGELPVYFELDSNDNLVKSFKIDWDNGKFIDDNEYWLKIKFGRVDEIEEVSKDEFTSTVNKLRHKMGFIDLKDEFTL